MSFSSADLRKLAGKKRSRANLEEAQSVIADMKETKDGLAEWLEKANAVQEAISELKHHQDQMDGDLMPSEVADAIAEAATSLEKALPGEGGALSEFGDLYEAADSAADELESMLEDRDYGAEERDEKWEELVEQLDYMADALDELAKLHEKSDNSENE